MSISVILNGYRRPENLKIQVESLLSQSITPAEILYWQNQPPSGVIPDEKTILSLNHCISSHNWGVWARFAYALNARSDYTCILDDDTIPGKDWLKNCVETYDKYPGLLGTIGLKFYPDYRSRYERFGWDGNNYETKQVDIVGHCWFFARDLLSVFWRELPPVNWNLRVGEDMHFSYMLQKYTKYKTWVPPHPSENKDLWGSIDGWTLGTKNSSASNEWKSMIIALDYYRDRGFKMISEEQHT